MTIRFWTWWNHGFVKLTLREDEHDEDNPLVLSRGQATDEGWSSLTERFWLECGSVYCETIDDGRDCDGRMTSVSRHYCLPKDLRANEPGEYTPDADVRLPHWTRARDGNSLYDEYAEAAGY